MIGNRGNCGIFKLTDKGRFVRHVQCSQTHRHNAPFVQNDDWNIQAEEFIRERYSMSAGSTVRVVRLYIERGKKYFGTSGPTAAVVGEALACMKEDECTYWMMKRTFEFTNMFTRWRAERGYLDRYYPVKAKFAKAIPERRPPMTRLDYQKLKTSKHYHFPMDYACVLGWSTGMRISDVMLLRWDSIDWDERVISYMPYKTRFRRPKIVRIPFGDDVEKVLKSARWRAGGPYNKHVIPTWAMEMESVKQAKSASHRFVTLARSVDVRKTFHCFRHGFVTRHLENGTPPHVIADMTGMCLATIESYTHVSLALKRKCLIA